MDPRMTDFVLSPLTWLLAAFALWLALRRWRWLRAGAFALGLVALLAMTPLGANALVALVEARAADAPPCIGDRPTDIVVPGAGLDHRPRSPADVGSLSADSTRRLLAGIDLFHATPGAHLYLVGASAFAIPESQLQAHLAIRLGVPPAAISVEATSATTWENARHLRALAPPPRRIALATSALHAPRALHAFRAAGYQPCLAVSESAYLPPGEIGYYLPRTSALRKAEKAIHEIVGDLVYRWYG
jgi:uncharacterized SAM-binding protein YcdF (DUF218 family)